MKKLQVIVSPKGEATIRTAGFAGSECRQASRSLERALGFPINELLTSEYYQSAEVNASERQPETAR